MQEKHIVFYMLCDSNISGKWRQVLWRKKEKVYDGILQWKYLLLKLQWVYLSQNPNFLMDFTSIRKTFLKRNYSLESKIKTLPPSLLFYFSLLLPSSPILSSATPIFHTLSFGYLPSLPWPPSILISSIILLLLFLFFTRLLLLPPIAPILSLPILLQWSRIYDIVLSILLAITFVNWFELFIVNLLIHTFVIKRSECSNY